MRIKITLYFISVGKLIERDYIKIKIGENWLAFDIITVGY